MTGGGAGAKINGIIQQYKVGGGSISAGDFVEYVSGVGAGCTVFSGVNSWGYVGAAKIDDSRALLVLGYTSTLYGVVVTVRGDTITAGTPTQLETLSGYTGTPKAVLVDTNKALVLYTEGSYDVTYGKVVTISGTALTAGTRALIAGTGGDWGAMSVLDAIALTANKVLMIRNDYDSFPYLYGQVLTVSGTGITVGSEKLLDNDSNTVKHAHGVLIGTNKVLLVYGNSNIYARTLTISDTSITLGTRASQGTYWSYLSEQRQTSLAPLGSNRALFVFPGGSAAAVSGVVVSVSGDTVTFGTATQISAPTGNMDGLTLLATGTDEAAVFFHYNPFYMVPVVVESTVITAQSATALAGAAADGHRPGNVQMLDACAVVLSFDATNSTWDLIGRVWASGVFPASRSLVSGVAKTGGGTGDTIQVYVPDI